jgi:hypothetical protein
MAHILAGVKLMKSHRAVEVKIPKETVMTWVRERFPELPQDTEIDQVTCYSHCEEVTVKLHCNFDPPKDEKGQNSVD